MKIKTTCLLVLATFIFLSSCFIKTDIVSKRDEDFNKKINTVFLLLKGSSEYKKLENDIAEELENYFENRGMEFIYFHVNRIEFSAKSDLIKKEIETTNPDVILMLENTETARSDKFDFWANQNTSKAGIVYEVDIIAYPENKFYMSSTLRAIASSEHFASVKNVKTAQLLSKRLISELKIQQIIPPYASRDSIN